MPTNEKIRKERACEVEDLRARLDEAEETLRAIRSGEVDGLIVSTPQGDQVFTLQGAEHPYRVLIEQMNEGAITLSEDGVILYCNRCFAALVKTPLDRVIGAAFDSFLPPAQHEAFAAMRQKAQSGGCAGEITVCPGDGPLTPLWLSLSSMPADSIGVVCVVATDLTEAKRKEEALRRANDELEQRVAERTAELAQTVQELKFSQNEVRSMLENAVQSRQAIEIINRDLKHQITERKRAEEALQEKNADLIRFNYTVSHDLRSPLVTIKSFLGQLTIDMALANPERITQDLGFMNKAADKMNALLEELLNLSRIDHKKNPLEETPLHDILQEALILTAGRIDARGVRVWVTEEPVLLYGDRVRLVEVFQNLIDNAAKFMGDQSEPLVEIGASVNNYEVMIFVRDNGMGIDLKYKGKIFGLFEKLNPELDGTGMGLALVKRIVELHGGRIWVESEGIGKGVCFWFSLPGKSSEL